MGGSILSHHLVPSGGNYRRAAEKVIEGALGKAGLSLEGLSLVVATGYGAANVPFAGEQATELACQGRGVNYLFPRARTVIDVGGQASKVIKVDARGRVTDFVISEKCAAGSGRFLQVIARVLGVELEDIGPLSLKSSDGVKFSTSCAVFAESEAISRITEGARKEDILAGVHHAIAAKILNLVQRVGLEKECAITGGGAKDVGLVKRVEERLGTHLLVPQEPQITAALGAALIAGERWSERRRQA